MGFSFDFPLQFSPRANLDDIVIIQMDESSHRELKQTYGMRWDRKLHARLLQKLKADHARMAVLDIFLADPGTPEEDQALSNALRAFEKVVLAAVPRPASYSAFPLPPGYRSEDPIPPADIFLSAVGDRWGIAAVFKDKFDSVLRQHLPEPLDTAHASLPWAAAKLYGAPVTSDSAVRKRPRWTCYYGPTGTFAKMSYSAALKAPAGFFADKIVFVGGRPSTDFVGSSSDNFSTPFTRWTGVFPAGVEILATTFLNLVRNDWLSRLSAGSELVLIALAGIGFGWGFSRLRPVPGALAALASILVVTAAGVLSFWLLRTWFDWALIAGVQIPVAWTSSAVLNSRRVIQEKEGLKKKLDELEGQLGELRRLQRLPAESPASSPPENPTQLDHMPCSGAEVTVPNCNLIKRIGEGAFGEVWLGWNVTSYRAIKMVFRSNFPAQRPFDREFEGLRNFEPVSRLHRGWVNILHVGRNDPAGFFYYEMEPADDLAGGRRIDPDTYVPKTLSSLLVEEPWLSVADCIRIGADLADAIGALHDIGLVHRDIKPSNIIFVNGTPKLADIGLVAKAHEPKSIGGTLGFMPSTNLGTPRADIFGLGRLLYQAATGSPASRYPGIPTSISERTDARELMRLMELINKACSESDHVFYGSAAEFRDDLLRLQASLNRPAKPRAQKPARSVRAG